MTTAVSERVVSGRLDTVRLNLGCGLLAAPGWINIDGSWNARLAKHPFLRRTLAKLGILSREKSEIPWASTIFIHNIRKPLPFPDNCASAIYASHVLEHLYFEEGRQLIQESFRVLCGEGILRIVVPDLHTIVREYLGERPFAPLSTEMEALRPADRFNQRVLMRWPTPSSRNLFYRIYDAWQDFHSHKWMDVRCGLAYGSPIEMRVCEYRAQRLLREPDCRHPRIGRSEPNSRWCRYLRGGGKASLKWPAHDRHSHSRRRTRHRDCAGL